MPALTLALVLGLAGSACKDDSQQAAKNVDTAIDNAAKQAANVREAEGDVARAREVVVDRSAEVTEAKGVLAERAGAVVMARGEYLSQLQIRVADVDVRIAAADPAKVDLPRVTALRKELDDRVRTAIAVADAG